MDQYDCIAGDFTTYDQHAVKQINRNIELIRYRRYGDDLLLLELVNATTATASGAGAAKADAAVGPKTGSGAGPRSQDVGCRLAQASPSVRDLYEQLAATLQALGEDVQVDLTHPALRDMRNIGHYGTGDLEITFRTPADIETHQGLLLRSYEAS